MNHAIESLRVKLQGDDLLPLFEEITAKAEEVDRVNREYNEWAVKMMESTGTSDPEIEALKNEDCDGKARQCINMIVLSFTMITVAPPAHRKWAEEKLVGKMKEAVRSWQEVIDHLEPQIMLAKMAVACDTKKEKSESPAMKRMRGDIDYGVN